MLKEKGEFEREGRETRRELQNHEKRLINKEEGIDKRVETIEKRDSELARREISLKSREKNIEEKAAECDRQIDAARKQLEQVAGMTREEAKKSLIDQMVEEAKHDSSKRIRVIEEEAKEEAARKSQKIIALAIERLAGDFVAERSVTVMPLPNDELKGKIIGREGRNIRALEAATGIDLIVDDTPETVVISGHNPIRREIARLSLEKLISDGHLGTVMELRARGKEDPTRGGAEDLWVLGSHMMNLMTAFVGPAAWCFATVTDKDQPITKAQGDVTADLLKRLGMNVDFAAIDWGTVGARRAMKTPPGQGGWQMFHTWHSGADCINPAVAIGVRASGEKAWFGWPDAPEVETQVTALYEAKTLDEEKAAIGRLNKAALDNVVFAPTGFFLGYQAWRKNVSGVVKGPLPFFWGVGKVA